MTRWAAAVEYSGSRFCGWQAQRDCESVQAAVESALLQVADHAIVVTAAGRTDAGVHAYGQVIHFDSPAARTPYSWMLGVNTHLPADVSLRWVVAVAEGFDARRSARRRRYRYVIHNHRARAALLAERAAWVPLPLDAASMHRAAQALVGEHDFSAFRAAGCQSNTAIRALYEIAVSRQNDFVVVDVCANAFLQHMVRNIAGLLIEIGQARRGEGWAAQVLAGRDRTQAAITAPACGLYFVGPEYAPEFGLPTPAQVWFPG